MRPSIAKLSSSPRTRSGQGSSALQAHLPSVPRSTTRRLSTGVVPTRGRVSRSAASTSSTRYRRSGSYRAPTASFGNQFVEGSISRAGFAAFFRRLPRRGETRLPALPVPQEVPHGFLRRTEGMGSAAALSWCSRAQRRRLPSTFKVSARSGSPESGFSAASSQWPRWRGHTLTITKLASGAWRATVGFRNVAAVPPRHPGGRRGQGHRRYGPHSPMGPCSRCRGSCGPPATRSPSCSAGVGGTPSSARSGRG